MKRIATNILPTILIIALAFVSCRSGKNKAAADAPAVQGTADVQVFRVVPQRIAEHLSFTGTLEAWKQIAISPEIGGKIAGIYVREGDVVAKGRLLAELDTESVRLQLKQAEAGAAVAEAAFNDAAKNKERMDRLIKESAVSEQQYEKVKLAYDSAAAQLEQARAARNLAQHTLDISIMKAPFSGIIAARNGEVGDIINPQMGGVSALSGVLTLMDYSKIKVVVDLPQAAILRVSKGQPVILTSPGYPGREFQGEVTVAASTADPSSKKFRVEAVFDNASLELRPGTFGELTFEVDIHENVLVVPQRAVLEDSYVLVVREGKAVKQNVTLGIQNTNLVEILKGVSAGDPVIVGGNFGLAEGSAVRIAQEVAQ